MPRVTVGVPVYNGASMIRECLDCLAGQTHDDFEVLISDNASTDGTSEICAEFAARDPRFRHVRHETTMPVIDNFIFARDAGDAPFFMWRAYDDLSSPDYIERLSLLLERSPRAALAVGTVIRDRGADRAVRRVPPRLTHPLVPQSLAPARVLFTSHASWFYGLWRRERLVPLIDGVWRDYEHAWGSDHLALFPLIIEDRIVGTPEASFTQRILSEKRGRDGDIGAARMEETVAAFRDFCERAMAQAEMPPLRRRVIEALLPAYIARRCYSPGKIRRARRRQAGGR